MFGCLSLPEHWVYVHFPLRSENVANTDTLTTEEAMRFYSMWNSKEDPVLKISLETSDQKVLRQYAFDKNGKIRLEFLRISRN